MVVKKSRSSLSTSVISVPRSRVPHVNQRGLGVHAFKGPNDGPQSLFALYMQLNESYGTEGSSKVESESLFSHVIAIQSFTMQGKAGTPRMLDQFLTSTFNLLAWKYFIRLPARTDGSVKSFESHCSLHKTSPREQVIRMLAYKTHCQWSLVILLFFSRRYA